MPSKAQNAKPDTETPFLNISDFEPKASRNLEVLRYWQSIQKGRQMPQWPDFDPLNIASHLSCCLIVEFEAPDFLRVRLMGDKLVEWLGVEFTGKNALDIMDAAEHEDLVERIKVMLGTPALIRSVSLLQADLFDTLITELVVMPFAPDGGTIQRGLITNARIDTGYIPSYQRQASMSGRKRLELEYITL